MGRHYDDPLEFILDGEAESVSNGTCTDLSPSPKLRELWAKWDNLCHQAVARFWQANPRLVRVPVDVVFAEQDRGGYTMLGYEVFMSLNGSGVGIWDGDWDHYFTTDDGADKLVDVMKRLLAKAFRAMESAIQDEAMEECDRRKPKQSMLFED